MNLQIPICSPRYKDLKIATAQVVAIIMFTAISVSADLEFITRWSARATNLRPGAHNPEGRRFESCPRYKDLKIATAQVVAALMFTANSDTADSGFITRWSPRATNLRPGAHNVVVVGSKWTPAIRT